MRRVGLDRLEDAQRLGLGHRLRKIRFTRLPNGDQLRPARRDVLRRVGLDDLPDLAQLAGGERLDGIGLRCLPDRFQLDLVDRLRAVNLGSLTDDF